MNKTIDVITLMKLNTYLKDHSIPCILHYSGACDQSILSIENSDGIDLTQLEIMINAFLKDKFISLSLKDNHFFVK